MIKKVISYAMTNRIEDLSFFWYNVDRRIDNSLFF